MRNIADGLQNMGFRYGSGLEPHEIDHSEPIADGWSIGFSTEYNLIAVSHYSGVLAIHVDEIGGNTQQFYDAIKDSIAYDLAQSSSQSKQLSLF